MHLLLSFTFRNIYKSFYYKLINYYGVLNNEET